MKLVYCMADVYNPGGMERGCSTNSAGGLGAETVNCCL